VLHHALLGVAMLALVAAAIRVASPLAPDGLPRVLAAAPLAVAAAVGEALVLGLAGLGGSPAALTLAAVLTWLTVRALVRAPALAPAGELRTWWLSRPVGARVMVGALAGAAAAWAFWELRHPVFGIDSEFYHLPEIVIWVQGGHTGAIETVMPGLPVGNYPLTNEVTVAWGMGISHSFIPFMLWPWATLGLTAAAAWSGLRAIRVPPLVSALAALALCSSPWLLAWRSNGTMTDPAALAWLVCAASLVAHARRRPSLFLPAVLAAGLAVGVKTTTVPLAIVVVGLGWFACRGELRSRRLPLVIALLAALAVGGVWYVRNLLAHGSPFWPVVAAPWGDPVPHFIDLAKTRFLDRPAATIDHVGGLYGHRFAGALLLLGGALLAPLVARSRSVLAAAVITAAGLGLWMASPVTGTPRAPGLDQVTFSTTRYLLPVLAAATVTLALAGAARTRSSWVAGVTLAAAGAVNVAQALTIGTPTVPAPLTPLAGAVAGALVSLAVTRLPRLRYARAVLAVGAVGLGALLALPARHFVARYSATTSLGSSSLTAHLTADASYRAGASPVTSSPVFVAALAGDGLRHRLEGLVSDRTCAGVRRKIRRGWVVVYRKPIFDASVPLDARRCLPGVPPAFEDRNFTLFRPAVR
jgi:hypothetical protein